MTDDVRQAVELAARRSYGRLVAWLASRGRDVAGAEDAVAEALVAAMQRWPETGVPDNPEAWLLTAARRRAIDRGRRDTTRALAADRLRREAQEAADSPFVSGFPDRRLELMFVCAHPRLPENVRTPLILQTVLGVTPARVAGAMLVRPSVLSQRLVRAKRRIKQEGLPFEVPDRAELPARLHAVLEAIYAAYGTGWDATEDAEAGASGLTAEAIWLARLLVDLLPEAAEPKGLYALMLYCEARRDARRVDESFVPLEEQDTSRWNTAMLHEAEKALWMAAKLRAQGPFQAEAAIQSIHVDRARTGRTDWPKIHTLYTLLAERYPSLGATIGYAASFGRIGDPAAGLAVLDGLDAETVRHHQPYWAVRAHLLRESGDADAADEAFGHAIGLSGDPAVRRWLGERRASRSIE